MDCWVPVEIVLVCVSTFRELVVERFWRLSPRGSPHPPLDPENDGNPGCVCWYSHTNTFDTTRNSVFRVSDPVSWLVVVHSVRYLSNLFLNITDLIVIVCW